MTRCCFLSTLLLLAIIVTLPSPLSAFRPPTLSEELGCSPTLSMLLRRDFYFDPLRIATDTNFARLRECELKHGRVAMMAHLGIELPPLVKELAKQQDFKLSPEQLQFFPSPSIFKSAANLELVDWLNVLVTCGFLESFIFLQRDAGDMPGDYGTGYFGVRNKGLHERSLLAELENGRLAMLGFVGLLVAEKMTGMDATQQLQYIMEQVVKEIKQFT